MRELVQELSAYYKSEFENINIEIKYIYPEQVSLVLADKNIVREALREIYINLLKYTLPNTKVYIEIKEYGDNIYLSIKNVSKDEVSISSMRDEKYKGIKFIENSLYIQNIKVSISLEASLFKIIITFQK